MGPGKERKHQKNLEVLGILTGIVDLSTEFVSPRSMKFRRVTIFAVRFLVYICSEVRRLGRLCILILYDIAQQLGANRFIQL